MASFPAPLLSEQPRPNQIAAAVVAPAVLGAITGVLLGISEAGYTVLGLIAAVGGVLAGFDHRGAAEGAKRGALGGLLFGGFVLIAHQLEGSDAKADTADPEILLIVVTTVLGVLLGALGGWLRGRYEARART